MKPIAKELIEKLINYKKDFQAVKHLVEADKKWNFQIYLILLAGFYTGKKILSMKLPEHK